MWGEVIGHNISGQAIISNQYELPTTRPFSEIRLRNPFQRLEPNWARLPDGAKIVRPSPSTSATLKQLLAQRIPPGPSYADLVTEIWNRGFEVFVVGGTVRDAIADKTPNDVDLVTTMPLFLMKEFLHTMYRYDPEAAHERGFVRIGGTPASGDPFIDVKVFSSSLPGTPDAVFGVDFLRDVAHRDFACNATYFDPINDVIIDPTGFGISDAQNQQLTFICATNDLFQHAQIVIRTIKFSARGFSIAPSTLQRLQDDLVHALAVMKALTRVKYFRAQVLSKCPSSADHPAAVAAFRDQMISLGLQPHGTCTFFLSIHGYWHDWRSRFLDIYTRRKRRRYFCGVSRVD